MIHKIVGLPGTGKTTHLKDIILGLLNNGTEPDEILFSSFSKAASRAIYQKLAQAGYSEDVFKHFRTMHSLSAQVLGLKKEDNPYIITRDYEHFSNYHGLEYEPVVVKTLAEIEHEGLSVDEHVDKVGNLLFGWWQLLKKKHITEVKIRHGIRTRELLFGDQLDMLRQYPSGLLLELYDAWYDYKRMQDKFEYDDMIQEIVLNEVSFPADIRYMFIDEAQDISYLQFELAKLWMKQCEETWLAYDTLQTIYFFNLADPELVASLGGKPEVLARSYRVPRAPWESARQIAHIIGNRTIDHVAPKDEEGKVSFIDYDSVFKQMPNSGKATYMLFRSNYRRNEFLNECYDRDMIPLGFGRRIKPTPANFPLFRAYYDVLVALYNNKPVNTDDAKRVLLSMPAMYFRKRGIKRKIGKNEIDSVELSKNFLYFITHDYCSIEGLKNIIGDAKVKVARKQLLLATSPSSLPVLKNVFVGTIFSSKGMGAERVFLFDYYPHKEANIRRDECRIAFVGVTRTSNELYIVSLPEAAPLSRRAVPFVQSLLEDGKNSMWLPAAPKSQ